MLESAHDWLQSTSVPKVLFWATPGGMIPEAEVNWYAGHLQNTRAVGIGPGIHYLQEDNPHLIGLEINSWLQGS